MSVASGNSSGGSTKNKDWINPKIEINNEYVELNQFTKLWPAAKFKRKSIIWTAINFFQLKQLFILIFL